MFGKTLLIFAILFDAHKLGLYSSTLKKAHDPQKT